MMKSKLLVYLITALLIFSMALSLVACAEEEVATQSTPSTISSASPSSGSTQDPNASQSHTASDSTNDSSTSSSEGEPQANATISFSADMTSEAEIKACAYVSLKNLYNDYSARLTGTDKKMLDVVYLAAIYNVATADAGTEALKEKLNQTYAAVYYVAEASAFATTTVEQAKTLVLNQLEKIYSEAQKVVALTDQIKSEYETVKQSVKDAATKENLEQIKNAALSAFYDKISQYVSIAATEKIESLKATAKSALDTAKDNLLAKITDEELKTQINNYYDREVAVINGVSSLNDAPAALNQVKADTEEFVKQVAASQLAKLKAAAKAELDTAKDNLLAKITDEELKTQINNYYDREVAVINGVSSLNDAPAALNQVKADTEEFVKQVVASQLAKLKAAAKAELDTSKDNLLAKITDEELKTQINNYYNQEVAVINGVTSLDDAPAALKQVKDDTEEFVKQVAASQLTKLKAAAKTELDTAKDNLLAKITDEELKTQINNYYNQEVAVINGVTSLDEAPTALAQVKTDTEEFVKQVVASQLAKLKAAAKAELDTAKDNLLAKITDEELKTQINNYYNQEVAVINGVTSLDDATTALAQVKTDTEEFVKQVAASQVAKLKAAAKAELDNYVTTALSKLKDESLKTQLSNFYATEIAKIDAINSLDTAESTIKEVVTDVKNFALELVASQTAELRATVKGYLKLLTDVLASDPYSYIPSAMQPGYSANLVTQAQVTYDFTSFVNVNSIKYGGFGEQWNMVIDNIEQSQKFYKYLNVGDSALAAAMGLFNAYLDDKYSESPDHTIENETFLAEISFADNVLAFTLQYKTGITIPMFGSVTPTIRMTYDVAENEKDVHVTLTDTNKMRYVVSENKYEFAIEYGIDSLSRSAYASFERNNGKVEGHIYEYTTVKGKDAVKACADFYIDGDYVSVVGNKASGMVGFTGYINELYKASEGKLLGYEVQETLTIAGVSGTYNTLWFNLSDVSGITSVKVTEKSKDNPSDKSTADVYLNGSATLFAPTYNTKTVVFVTTKTSRKYDIEMRTQYFYGKDANGDLVKYEVSLPMMFIQQDNDTDTNFTDYPADMLKDNGITSSVTLNSTYLNKIMSDYATLIDVFKTNKDKIDSEKIKAFIAA